MRLEYLSKTNGIGGRIKEKIEDFAVEEVMKDGTVLELDKKITLEKKTASENENADFVHFVLQKKNWNTMQAIQAIAKALHATKKRFNYAGNKDRRAVTTQLASAFKIDCGKLEGLRIKDIQINGCWKAGEKIRLGGLQGNRFSIIVRGACADAGERIKKIAGELNGVFPNYFGEQRFGAVRSNTHLVGKAVVQGNFREAVENYLTYSSGGEELEEARNARERLRQEHDYKQALAYFPNHLKYERTLLAHLSQHPNDYVNALRKLPRGLNLMFVHAYQSYLFNELLSERVREGELKLEEGERGENGLIAGKIIGSSTVLSGREKALMEREGVSIEAFKIPSFPEIGSKGGERLLLAPFTEFDFSVLGEGVACLRFCLRAGSYATVLLSEFMDAK